MNEVERLEEKMKSKNWKERQEAYVRFKDFINQEDFAFLIPLIQNETNIPALESGIEALLQAEKVPPVESVAKIFGHIGNLKTSVRTKVVNLIEFISKKYHNQCVNVLVDYILLKSTPPKTVAGAISVLVEITDKYDLNLEIVGSSLKQIFGHADKSVRGEGTRLCINLYKKFGENIRKFIKDLKPIQLKELEEEFNKIQPEINKKDYAPLSLSNSKFLKKCNDEKWNIRLEGLNELKAQIPFTFDNEILSIFYTRISDPNNQVFFELLEILSLTKLKNQRIVNGLVERLKDKKTIVCEKIKETLLKMELPEDFLQKEYFTHKNPQVKINIIDFALKREVKRKDVEEWVKGCTKDQNGQVRSKANEFLNKKNMEGNKGQDAGSKVKDDGSKVHDKGVNNKIGSKAQDSKIGIGIGNKVEDCNTSINTPITTTPTKVINTPIKRIKTSYFGPTQEEKDSILNSFYSKYPFFKEKMWNTRLDSLKDNTSLLLKEEIRDLMVFFYSHKENIFQLNLAHLDLLSKRQKELDLVKNTLLLYCTEKITENKLQNKIVEILKKIDQKETILFIKNEIKNLKQGKKLICLIWLIGELISKKNCEIDEILKKNVTGINEKKAIEGLKKRFDEVQSVCELNSEDGLNGEDELNGEDGLDIEDGLNEPTNGFNRKGHISEPTNKRMDKPMDEPTTEQVEDEPTNKRMDNTKKNTSINFFTNEMKNEINNLNFELNQPIKKAISPIHPSYPVAPIQPSLNNTPLNKTPLNKPPQVLKTNKRFLGDKEEDIFTLDFIQILHSSDFTKVLDLFNTTDKILISDFIIKYHVEKRLASSYFNSLILFFISEKYILKENECLILLSYLLKNNLKEELKMMDRIYPVTKLFFVLQKIGTDEAINEILRLIESYKMFRGDKKKFIEKLKETNLKKLKKTVRECPDFLSFIDEIDEQFLNEKGCESVNRDVSRDYEEKEDVRDYEGKEDVQDKGTEFKAALKLLDTTTKITHHSPTKVPNTPPLKTTSELLAPSVLDDPFQDPLIETSLHSLSLNSGFNTPNLNKFKKDFESPIKKRNSIDTLEDILDNLIDSNQDKSEKAFLRLSGLVDDNMPSLLFSANSIISSISIQLLDVLHRPLYATLILNVLLKLSKSQLFCEELRVETLESVNSDLITMFDSLNKDRNPSKDHLQLVLDIITNLSLNCKPLMAIQVYLNLFSKGGNRDIHLRLIWRHSKCLNQIDKDNLEGIIEVFEKFYSKHVYSPFMENRTTFKMLILHIGQIVLKYPKEIEKMKLKGYTKILIGLFKTKSSIKIEDLRRK